MRLRCCSAPPPTHPPRRHWRTTSARSSTVEHGPADLIAQPLIVENQLASALDSLAELARCKSIHLFCGSLIFEHRAMGDPVAMEQTDTTAQDVYKQMLREHVAPALRELGFGGAPSRGNFRYETATHAAEVRFQKSRYSSKQEVDFWVNLYAVDIKTERVYWDWTLDGLAQLWGDRGEWTIYAGDPIEPVASQVVRSLRTHAWPAIQAALDNPGYPPDPAARWSRTFPKLAPGPLLPEEEAAIWRARSNVYHTSKWARNETFALLEILEKDPLRGSA